MTTTRARDRTQSATGDKGNGRTTKRDFQRCVSYLKRTRYARNIYLNETEASFSEINV